VASVGQPICFNTPGFFVLQEELHPQGRPFIF